MCLSSMRLNVKAQFVEILLQQIHNIPYIIVIPNRICHEPSTLPFHLLPPLQINIFLLFHTIYTQIIKRRKSTVLIDWRISGLCWILRSCGCFVFRVLRLLRLLFLFSAVKRGLRDIIHLKWSTSYETWVSDE